MAYAFLAGIVAIMAIATHFAFQESRAGSTSFVAILLAANLGLAGLGVLRIWRDGGAPRLYRRYSIEEGRATGWFAVRSGDFTIGALSAAALFASAWAYTHFVTPNDSKHFLWMGRLYEQIGKVEDLRKHVAGVIIVIIVIAIAEEVLWRGVVTSLAEEIVGSRRAWVVSAFLYALAHAPTIWALGDKVAGPNPTIVLACLAAGVLWGGMARRFDRLLPSVFSHVLFDWTVVMMFRLWGPGI